jgi:DNA-binding PadR family transcriptional regulator
MSESVLPFKGFLKFLILHELKYGEFSGSELAEKIGERRGSKLTPGTIYPALKDLHNDRLVRYRSEGRKKLYRLSEQGEGELEKAYCDFSQYFYGLKKQIRRDRLPDDAKAS